MSSKFLYDYDNYDNNQSQPIIIKYMYYGYV